MSPASTVTGRRNLLRRTAFSLLEVLVVVSLVLTVAASAALYYVSGNKQSAALDFHAAALQSAQLVVSHLRHDLGNLVPGPLLTSSAVPGPNQAVTLTCISEQSDSRGLPLDEMDELLTDTVYWRFDSTSHLLSRNGEPIRAAPLEAVEFTFFPCRPGETTPPFGDTLIVRIVAVPLEALGRTTSETPRAVFTASFHSPQGTVNHSHEDWAGDR